MAACEIPGCVRLGITNVTGKGKLCAKHADEHAGPDQRCTFPGCSAMRTIGTRCMKHVDGSRSTPPRQESPLRVTAAPSQSTTTPAPTPSSEPEPRAPSAPSQSPPAEVVRLLPPNVTPDEDMVPAPHLRDQGTEAIAEGMLRLIEEYARESDKGVGVAALSDLTGVPANRLGPALQRLAREGRASRAVLDGESRWFPGDTAPQGDGTAPKRQGGPRRPRSRPASAPSPAPVAGAGPVLDSIRALVKAGVDVGVATKACAPLLATVPDEALVAVVATAPRDRLLRWAIETEGA